MNRAEEIAAQRKSIREIMDENPESSNSGRQAYSGFDAVSIDGDPMSVRALKLAYRKHVKDDDSIGWDDLGDTLAMALAQIMGDEEFCLWSESEEAND